LRHIAPGTLVEDLGVTSERRQGWRGSRKQRF